MQNKSGIKDLTQGNMMKNMLVFSLPMLLGNVFQNLYNWVDSIIVGKALGEKAFAAISVAFPIMFILISVILGFTMAVSILISQFAGAKNESMIRKTISTTTIFIGGSAIVITLIGIVFSRQLLTFVKTPAEIINDAQAYLVIIMAGMIFMFGYNMVSGVLRGLGDTITPMIFLIIATVINAILDYVFIVGVGPFPSMGVGGAALATVIAQGTSYIMSLIYLGRKGHIISFKLSELKFDKDIMLRIVKLGIPSAVQQFVVSFGWMVLSIIINVYGSDVIAAYSAGSKIDSFAMLPAMTLSFATATLTGQCIGAGKKDRVKEVLKNGAILALIFALSTVGFVYLFGRASLYLFLNQPHIIDLGVVYLKIVSLSYVFMGLNFVMNGIIRGAGDIWVSTIITAISFLGLRVPLAYLLSTRFSWGSTGIWISFPISFAIGLIINYCYYKTGRWMNKEIIRKSERNTTGEEIIDKNDKECRELLLEE